MRKKFAPLAMLFGLLTALLGSTATAQADTAMWTCTGNQSVNIITCSTVFNGIPIKITIRGTRVLTENEIVRLERTLATTPPDLGKIENAVVNTYKSFSPPINITVDHVDACMFKEGGWVCQ